MTGGWGGCSQKNWPSSSLAGERWGALLAVQIEINPSPIIRRACSRTPFPVS
jgi:hypothetical protein